MRKLITGKGRPRKRVQPEPLFPRQSMWWPYWKGRDIDAVAEIAGQMRYMGQTGVVLMGMEWGNDYALPADVAAKLALFRSEGIKPFLGLWVGRLTQPEADTAVRAWEAGNGLWEGIVLDAEHGWKKLCGEDLALARSNFDAFMARVRPLTGKLGYAPYGVPGFHKVYQYEWWNEVCDFALPQIYFSGDDTADFILNRAFKSWNNISDGWATPLKPLIPLGNCYGEFADPVQRMAFGKRAIAERGSVSWWRFPILNPEVEKVLSQL